MIYVESRATLPLLYSCARVLELQPPRKTGGLGGILSVDPRARPQHAITGH